MSDQEAANRLGFQGDAETGRRVYFLEGKRTKLIKIGVANNVARRMRDIQNMSPDKLLLITDISGNANDEAELHRILSKFRVWGEWFLPGPWVNKLRAFSDAKSLIEALEAQAR
jgi:hypothetical protein